MFKSLNKGVSTPIAIIIIVVLAVIVGGGILVYQYKFAPKESEFTPTPPPKNETANWKTYRNEGYGFEIDYPVLGWEFKDYDYYQGSPTVFSLCKQQSEELEKKEICIFATIMPISNMCDNLSLEKIVVNADCFNASAWYMKVEKEITTNSGMTGVIGKGLDGTDEARGVFFLIPKKLGEGVSSFYPVFFLKYFIRSLPAGNSEIVYPFASEKEEVINQMLSTFKFFGVEDETANWKTYRNEGYGFEIKYPQNYTISISEGYSPLTHPENLKRISVIPIGIAPDVDNPYINIDIVDLKDFTNVYDYINKTYGDKISLIESNIYKLKNSDFFFDVLRNENYIFNISSPSKEFLVKMLSTFGNELRWE